MTTPLLIDDLKRDEGLCLKAYRDTLGNWTIGYGHTPAVEGAVWTVEAARIQLQADVETVLTRLDRELAWWRGLDDVRQDALANMAFNIGVGGLRGFHHMLEALEAHDWRTASAHMLLSEWAEQVGDRAERLAFMIRNGTRASFAKASPFALQAPADRSEGRPFPAPAPSSRPSAARAGTQGISTHLATANPAAASRPPGSSPGQALGPASPPRCVRDEGFESSEISMTDTPPSPTPIQTATLDLARSALMAAGAIPLAHGLATASQWQAIVGGLIALGSAVWSYVAAHPSRTGALASLLGTVRKGAQGQAWNGDVTALEAAILPLVEKAVDAQIKARAGVLAGPVDMAANAAIKDAAGQVVSHLRI
jgi:lysozyme